MSWLVQYGSETPCVVLPYPDLWRSVRKPLGARIAPVWSASVGGCFIDAIRSPLDGVNKRFWNET